ncbi:hypothetical protein [Anaerocolumna sp. MB42-C2]|uniref:hypothetical protein n=1 Tax=Anaerocolumna sp. MB42-C2 TaxID=3070997 RepID=UPI0027DF7DF8|nr:hypothetical protein [Anaerocolumna sp. MB42-C2]WMJ89763.1 hypothetical protein RBU59_09585 [Anaerocolumna sp. MB42-C2]
MVLVKCLRVFSYRFRFSFSSARIPLIFILTAIFVYSNIENVSEMSASLGIPCRPYLFPHLVNDFICQLVFMGAVIVLFCDAPFTDDVTMYFKYRSGRLSWTMGHAIYIIALSFLFILMIMMVSTFALFPHLEFGESWGKIINTLGKTNIGSQYGVAFRVSDYLIGAYLPLKAMVYTFLLEWVCAAWLGLLIYSGNLLTLKPIGTFASAGFVLMDITIANEGALSSYKFSPLTLAQLASLTGLNRQLGGITLHYSIRFFIITLGILLFTCAFGEKIQYLAALGLQKLKRGGNLYG